MKASEWKSLSHVQLFATPWPIQTMEFSRPELEWVAFAFSRESFQPRDQTQVSHIAGRFFTSRATREAPNERSRKKEIPSIGEKKTSFLLC